MNFQVFLLNVFLDTVTSLKRSITNITCPNPGKEISLSSGWGMTLFHMLIQCFSAVVLSEANRACMFGIVIAFWQILSLVLQEGYSTKREN